MTHPLAYGIPHGKFREGQREAIDWLNGTEKPFLLLQAPVGSGKSAIGAGLSKFGSVRVTTASINLQDQYKDGYRFHALYGMRNYPCALLPLWQADGCSYPHNMTKCPVVEDCEYFNEREKAKKARKVALSYAYYLSAPWTRENPSDFLYMDEAHLLLLSILREHCSVEYDVNILRREGLDLWQFTGREGLDLALALLWLKKLLVKLTIKLRTLKSKKHLTARMGQMVAATIREIENNERMIRLLNEKPEDFWVKLTDDRLLIRPLTVSAFARDFLVGADKIVFTSATIGHPKSFADELGIGMDEWAFHDMPSQWMPYEMPIFTYKDAPRLAHDMSEAAKKQWADIIASIITENNPDWSALIHVASLAQERELAERLARRIDPNRIYITGGDNTGDKITKWQEQLKRVSNTVAISSSFRQGLDAPEVNINVIAKVPFMTLDEYGVSFLRRNKPMYRWMAATGVMQAAGRIRRGEPEHYEVPGESTRKVVAIVDNAWTQVQEDFSAHFMNCLTEI